MTEEERSRARSQATLQLTVKNYSKRKDGNRTCEINGECGHGKNINVMIASTEEML